MKFYMAPLEGVTSYIFRNAQYAAFHPADKYFTPFITPGINSTRKSKALKDVLPENNQAKNIVPQIMTNRADEWLYTENQLLDMGYDEMNLNLGCPSGTVVSKKRGSGLLKYPEMLEALLDDIFGQTHAKISLKTRLGMENAKEFERLLDIYNQYPVHELIIHPRTREDYYKGKPDFEAYRYAIKNSKAPVVFNGNIFDASDYKAFCEQLPKESAVMIGRGLVANPALIGEITGQGPMLDKMSLRAFHDRVYKDYEEIMYGDTPLLYKMKELWNYMIWMFEDPRAYDKKIRKSKKISEYHALVDRLFDEQELAGDRAFCPPN